MTSVAESSLEAAGLFEAELLTQLLLWRWDHPSKDDAEFRDNLLENAATVLRRAVEGQQFIEPVPAAEMNLVAAIWYAEWNSIASQGEDPDGGRHRWLECIRRTTTSAEPVKPGVLQAMNR